MANERYSRTIKSYADLRVWQVAMELAEQACLLSEQFPQREWYGLASQVRRSAVSIPSNIAEGHTRESNREFIQFVAIARSSLTELETQVKFAHRLSFVAWEDLDEFLE